MSRPKEDLVTAACSFGIAPLATRAKIKIALGDNKERLTELGIGPGRTSKNTKGYSFWKDAQVND